ncbi:hypothetical protein [Nonomuraea roseola]|uniref:Secreted protein n=1 Tax=Nonomuraea roseola TaxID=46179 RepID=A0ABV5Q1Q3_9ACTN
MNRVIKAAVAVAICGLGAAVAAPAQAQSSTNDRSDVNLIEYVADSIDVDGPYEMVLNLVREVTEGEMEAAAIEEHAVPRPLRRAGDTLAEGVYDATGATASTAKKSMDSLSNYTQRRNLVDRVLVKADQAVPETGGPRLSPLVDSVTPAEAAPVVGTLPGVADTASIDEIAPLVDVAASAVDNNAEKATHSTSETLHSVSESVAQLTDEAAQN